MSPQILEEKQKGLTASELKLIEFHKSVIAAMPPFAPLPPLKTRYMVMDPSTNFYVDTDEFGNRIDEE